MHLQGIHFVDFCFGFCSFFGIAYQGKDIVLNYI
jgi:hypothetical protein